MVLRAEPLLLKKETLDESVALSKYRPEYCHHLGNHALGKTSLSNSIFQINNTNHESKNKIHLIKNPTIMKNHKIVERNILKHLIIFNYPNI